MSHVARLVSGVLLVGVTLVPVAGGADRASPSLEALLARHAPIVVLHPAERFRPVPVNGFLADADLQRKTATGWENVAGPLPVGGADLRLDQRSCQAVEGVAASPCYAAAEAKHGASPVVYGAAFRRKDRIDLQYWLWYPYNDYSPTVPAGDLWQVHEGDWEAVSVILDLQGRPLVAGYSQHSEGKRRDWARVPKRGARPLVYVALGSHANYFAPGANRLDPRVVDPLLIEIITSYGLAPVDHTAKGPEIRPRLIRVGGSSPSWMRFAGTWGEDGYVHFPGNAPLASGAGPRGPAFHEQWRTPVKEVLSWPRDSGGAYRREQSLQDDPARSGRGDHHIYPPMKGRDLDTCGLEDLMVRKVLDAFAARCFARPSQVG
ncbi:MAG TPA: Vps62-related protein [Gaiellaceae bacterium]|nr:Vps62-related protein [Gaiellaceae bacterium]